MESRRLKTECIITTDGLDSHGYGQLRVDGRMTKSHRVAYAEKIGMYVFDLPAGVVMHSCDNPACINKEHLSLGTAKQNSQDAVSKLRQAYNERNGNAKLTYDTVRAIREDPNPNLSYRARKYGVSRTQVGRIVRGEHWSRETQAL